mmetsp:Transcript_50600/g.58227  ORF Transcript_50600/g.58227 Transcript_50600/m.58227 type:complete len:267 (+) Transcript_50600:64-864(+)
MRGLLCVALVAMVLCGMVSAQDPAPGWLAYATASCPAGTKITHMEAKWTVGANPPFSFAFFSPWFGIDTSDNLNLLQPVNPWMGAGWSIYTEYYQWSPSNNLDSDQYTVMAGDQLWGKITYNGDEKQSYTLSQTDVTTGQTSQMTVPVQKVNGVYKNYTVQYIVYEKVAQCNQYGADQKVVFSDIKVLCNNAAIEPKWTTGVVENVCDFKAHVVSPSEVEITWNIDGAPPTPEQLRRSRGLKQLSQPRLSRVEEWRNMKKSQKQKN